MVDQSRWHPKGHVALVIRLLANRSGGAERLFCELANQLADEGYEVTCFTCEARRAPAFYKLSPRVTRINLWGKSARKAGPYRLIDTLSSIFPKAGASDVVDWMSKNLYFTRRLYNAFKHQRPDVVISFLPPANTPTLLAGFFSGTKVVPTNHNVPEQDYESLDRWDQNPIDRYLRLKALDFAARVHILFPSFAGWYPPHIQKKIVVVPNYVSRDFADVDLSLPRRKEVVAVGRLAPVKNYLNLVDAWAQIAQSCPDWTLKIYGSGPQEEQLRDRISTLKLTQVVHLMGQSSNVREAYLSAQALCHPALFEGFGLSVAEALACGLPVVAYADCAGVNEFVIDGSNGLMVQREGGPDALARGLEKLLKGDELRARLSANAPASVAHFTEQAFVKRWVTLIEELSPQRGRAS